MHKNNPILLKNIRVIDTSENLDQEMNITINNGDACSSNGPLTVASGYTIQIASGGSWVIL